MESFIEFNLGTNKVESTNSVFGVKKKFLENYFQYVLKIKWFGLLFYFNINSDLNPTQNILVFRTLKKPLSLKIHLNYHSILHLSNI